MLLKMEKEHKGFSQGGAQAGREQKPSVTTIKRSWGAKCVEGREKPLKEGEEKQKDPGLGEAEGSDI